MRQNRLKYLLMQRKDALATVIHKSISLVKAITIYAEGRYQSRILSTNIVLIISFYLSKGGGWQSDKDRGVVFILVLTLM